MSGAGVPSNVTCVLPTLETRAKVSLGVGFALHFHRGGLTLRRFRLGPFCVRLGFAGRDTATCGRDQLAPYRPEPVSYDQLNRYARAHFTSRLESATYDPAARTVTLRVSR